MATLCKKLKLGKDGNTPEVRVEWVGSPVPSPVLYYRTSSTVLYAEFCADEDFLDNYLSNVLFPCAIASIEGLAAGGAIGLIIDSLPTVVALYSAAVITCINEKLGRDTGTELHISLSAIQEPNEDWHRV